MTKIDFYIASTDSDEARLRLACKIVDKATQLDHHVFVHTASEQDAKQLDELLWTFSQGSFIPHRVLLDADAGSGPEPVLIGVNREPRDGRWDVLINLASEVPEFFSRYARVAEVVDANPARRDQSRERYRYYRDRGYQLDTHQL